MRQYRICTECEKPAPRLKRDRCQHCYLRHLAHLKAQGTYVPPQVIPAVDRLLTKVAAGWGGCWIWTGPISKVTGYGSFTISRGHRGSPHRMAYELLVGPIRPGLVVDHLCHNRDLGCPATAACLHRRCINPQHLEAVTYSENTLRSPFHISKRRAAGAR
jgi:hypothetical protein